jgi:shikimate kinase
MAAAPARKDNLVLIGMPGAGKSTVGVLLAKATGRDFLDTDVLIQAREGRSLQQLLDTLGRDAFIRLESRHLTALDARHTVIATGGSAVYGAGAMQRLAAGGRVVYLRLALEILERRIRNMGTRGIVKQPDQTLAEIFRQRSPLYQQWAEITIDGDGMTADQVVDAVLAALDEPQN